MRVFWVAILLVVFGVGPALSQETDFEWVLEEDFSFIESHDPGVLVLESAGGTRSDLDFGYVGLTYKVVSAWSTGKAIQVVYSPAGGTEVVDPSNGTRYPIVGAWPRVDALEARCKSENPSTVGKLACDAGSLAAWDSELNRAYQSLMKSGLSDSTKTGIRNAQRKWIEYRDASLAALEAYDADGSGGSIRRLQSSSARVGLTRNQAGQLLRYAAPSS